MVDSKDVTRILWYWRWLLSSLLLVLAFFLHKEVATELVIFASACLVLVNVVHRYLSRMIEASLLVFFLLCTDLLALGVGLAVSGGVMNPLIGFMVVPLAIGAIMLPWQLAGMMAVSAVGAYGVLTFWHYPLPLSHDGMANLFHWHLLGMWGNFVLTSLLMVASIAWLSARLVNQQKAISSMRDELTRREAVIAVATEAALTSHEMSTPLSTALMMVDELEECEDLPAQTAADIRLLGDQLRRCRGALRHIRRVADESRGQETGDIELSAFAADVELRFASLKPEACFHCTLGADIDKHTIRVNARALSAALLNLLDNAVEACPGDRTVSLAIHLDSDWANFDICGAGVRAPASFHDQAFPLSSKVHGLGVGILLSHATIEQAGGQLIWSADEAVAGNGLRVRIPVQRHAMVNQTRRAV